MSRKWLKAAAPVLVIAGGVVGMMAISATEQKEQDKQAIDTRPSIKVEPVIAEFHRVEISSFGEVKPLESTMLASQVSGEVVSWHPNFVAGGLVKRGDVLLEIEKDSYQAALLRAEAEYSRAQAALIEEKARAKVAAEEAKQLPKERVTDLYLRKPQLISAQAALKSAKAGLKIAKRDLNNCEVTAPYDALVKSRNVGVGQYVTTGFSLAQIDNIEYAEVTFPVAGFDQAFLPQDILGKEALIRIQNRAASRLAIIQRDTGVVDQQTRMIHLVARLEDPYSINNDQPPIKFGSYAEVSFEGLTLNDVYRIPQELVNNQTVWIVDDKEQLQPRRVNVIREEDQFFYVNQGLVNNDQLVMTLPEYPQAGMAVKIIEESALTAKSTSD